MTIQHIESIIIHRYLEYSYNSAVHWVMLIFAVPRNEAEELVDDVIEN